MKTKNSTLRIAFWVILVLMLIVPTSVLAFNNARPLNADSNASVVISQVYAGGGGPGAIYQDDYVEILNRGIVPVSLDGWSIQYDEGYLKFPRKIDLAGTIEPGQYLLIAISGGDTGLLLPTPDFTDTLLPWPISMAPHGGFVVLAQTTSFVFGSPISPIPVIDEAGTVDWLEYGSSLFMWLVSPHPLPAPQLTETEALVRLNDGCTNTGDASLDFVLAPANPRNSASPRTQCNFTQDPPPPDGMSFTSDGALDGWVLEARETSKRGGTLDATSPTLYLGDNDQDKQYRSFLSFDTSSLPEDARIVSAVMVLKEKDIIGTSPFETHGDLILDIATPYFGKSSSLELFDFQAKASLSNAGISVSRTSHWTWCQYRIELNDETITYINKTGLTQFRLRFTLDDNDDLSSDYIVSLSGDYSDVFEQQTRLTIRYYLPENDPEPTPTPIPPPTLPQCSDGLDNDGDGLIDLDDPECRNKNDNNEAS